MEINELNENGKLTIYLKGIFDALAASALDQKILYGMKDVNELVFDFTEVTYIASAGLRILVLANKMMHAKHGTMKVVHICPIVREVLEMTSLDTILCLED